MKDIRLKSKNDAKIILIAENNPDNIAVYETALSGTNYQLLVVGDAQSCLDHYRWGLEDAVVKRKMNNGEDTSYVIPFDAVLLSHGLIDNEWRHVAKQILSVNPHQRIVFMSDSSVFADELKDQFTRGVDIIQRPFEPDALIHLLESTEIYSALAKLGLNTQKLRECNLSHFQIIDLLGSCLALFEAQTGNRKDDTTHMGKGEEEL